VKSWGWINLGLALLLAVALGLAVGGFCPGNRHAVAWPDAMAQSPAFGEGAACPYLARGQISQLDPEGTRPRSGRAPRFGGGVEGGRAAGKVLRQPFDAQAPAVLERGRDVFVRDCMPCHGVGGRGDGPVPSAAGAGSMPRPASLLAEHARTLPDGYLYDYVSEGGLLMPAHGAQISPEDRWKVVAWVRRLQTQVPEAEPMQGGPQALSECAWVAALTPGPQGTLSAVAYEHFAAASGTVSPTLKAGTEAGAEAKWKAAQSVMDQSDCRTCHDREHPVIGPSFVQVAEKYRGQPQAAQALIRKIREGGSGVWGGVPMAPHRDLSETQLQTLVDGILALPGGQP